MSRVLRMLGKLFNGEPVLYVRQGKYLWDKQFKDGSWAYMTDMNKRHTLLYVAALCREWGRERPLHVLDVGCGNGGLAGLLRDVPGVTYVGIDISEEAIAEARTHHPEGRFYIASAESPPDLDRVFDLIVFNEILYYVPPRETFLRYQAWTTASSKVLITMYKNWRTALVWRVVRPLMTREGAISLTDRLLGGSWRIEWGAYRS